MNKRKLTYRLFCLFFAAFFMFSPLQSVFAEAVAETTETVLTEGNTAQSASGSESDTAANEDTITDDSSANTDNTNTVTTGSGTENSNDIIDSDITEEAGTEPTNENEQTDSSSSASPLMRSAASASAVTVSDLPVNIYDYNVVYKRYYNEDGSYKSRELVKDQGINKGHSLIFAGSPYWNGTSALDANTWINSFWPESGSSKDNLAVHGIVESQLVNGYPMLTALAGGESLEYLYTPNDDTSVMTAYSEGVTGLFNKQDNHYWFSSDDEDVTWDKSTNSFTKLQGNENKVKFLPFNTRSQTNDFEFGMTFTLDFEMPYDDSQTLNFTFKGDDDVWVYVDDTLVLDVGGIHGATGGTIDFKNKTVTYTYYPIMLGATSKEVTGNQKEFTFKELGFSDESFDAGSDHQLKFFYNERGEGLSNCYIDFNLPLLVETTISKEVWVEEDYQDFDVTNTYQFYLMYKAPNASEYTPFTSSDIKENYKPYKTGTDGTITNLSIDSSGKFALQERTSATFYLPQGSSYYIVEEQTKSTVGTATEGERPLYTTFQNDEDDPETVWNSDTSINITQTQITEIDSAKTKRATLVKNYVNDGRGFYIFQKRVDGLTKSVLGDRSYDFELTLADNYPSNIIYMTKEENGVTTYTPLAADVRDDGKKIVSFSLKDGEKIKLLVRVGTGDPEDPILGLNAIREVNPEDNEDYVRFTTYYDASSFGLSGYRYNPDRFYFRKNTTDKPNMIIVNEQTLHELTVTKNVTGNVADQSQKFDFTIRLMNENGEPLANEYFNEPEEVYEIIDDGGPDESEFTEETADSVENAEDEAADEEQDETLVTDENGEIKFSIASGESFKIKLPEGVKYTIVEDSQPSGYSTSAAVTRNRDGSEVALGSHQLETVTMTTDDVTATFTNNADLAPATSMNVNAYWPVGIGAVLLLGLIAFAVRRQIKGEPSKTES